MRTPDERSPYGLMQEDLRDQPWRLLVCCILLNLTSRKQAQPVWEEFFRRWPTPHDLRVSNDGWMSSQTVIEMTELLRPLGFQNRRVGRIQLMTRDFVRWDKKDPGSLYGIGKYGSDSYRIFIIGELVEDVQDKELVRYVEWAKERQRSRDEATHAGGA